MKDKILIWPVLGVGLLLASAGCNNSNNNKPAVPATQGPSAQPGASKANETEDFAQAFARFNHSVQTEDAAAFNTFIHPKHALYVVEQPGAVPRYTRVTDIQQFNSTFQEKSFFTINKVFTSCNLTEASLPAFNCDGTTGNGVGYAKEGCFVAGPEAFQKNNGHHFAGLTSTEIKTIDQTKTILQKTVLHTGSSYKFHFGQIAGKWYVLFIELIVPCSA